MRFVEVSRRWRLALWLLVVPFLVPTPSVQSAQRVVLVEKFSASWCSHCMTAAQAVDNLVTSYPNKFIPLEIFTSTSSRYTTSWGISRGLTYYGVTSYPTTWFDGVSQKLGSADAYASYLNSITTRSNVATDVTVDLSVAHTSGRNYNVTIHVGLESGAAAKTVRLYLIEALDHYGIYDDMSTVPRNTFWQQFLSGIDLTLSPGSSQQIAGSLAFDDVSWSHFADVRLVAWAQAPASAGPAEVYNATQSLLPPMVTGDFNRDGVVDAADYTVWRDSLGRTGAGLAADGDGDRDVDSADYGVWKANYGSGNSPGSAGLASIAGVPEPATSALAVCAPLVLCVRSRRIRWRGQLALSFVAHVSCSGRIVFCWQGRERVASCTF